MATAAPLVPSSPASIAFVLGSPSRDFVSREDVREQKIRKLQTNLVRYSRLNDKKMVLRSLEEATFLTSLELDVADQSEYSSFDLETEIITHTTLDVNGLQFLQQGESGKDTRNGLAMLKMFCDRMCDDNSVNVHHRAVYKTLIPKMAPSTASADPYFRLNSLLGSSDLLVMPITQNQIIPIELNLFASGGSVHMRMTEKFRFGLFRKVDVKHNTPWITVEATSTERANFGTGESTRFLNLSVADA
ncbi:unnamed protein product [Cylindrotheca closterium]|uniref:Uncharacterized protein n=1 Tax=Cylindrotheca closterium TaxID=2856 RepID=A0AAD2CQ59_9STRA|nr:unnamed protein product [Cylindrotheca closterium]